MSIPNLIYKIKSKTGIDRLTIMYLFIIVGVGIGSFGLGRISVNNDGIAEKSVTVSDKEDNNMLASLNMNISNNNVPINEEQGREKRYVASKNGKMYYSTGCSGAKRIKPENQVWFSTASDAEKSGYALSSTCK